MSELAIGKPEEIRIPGIVHQPEQLTYEARLEFRKLLGTGEITKPFDDIDILEPVYAVAEQLNPYLESYTLVVADDTSGRLPALLYWRLVNLARKDAGLPKAEIRFHNGWVEAYKAPLKSVPGTPSDGSRALVVTDSFQTGDRAMNAYEAAAKTYGQDAVDLVAVGLERFRFKESLHLGRMSTQSNLFYGTTQSKLVDAYLHYGQKNFRGVEGTKGKTKYSVTMASVDADKDKYRPAVTAARKTANNLAEVFYRLLRPKSKRTKLEEKILRASQAILPSR